MVFNHNISNLLLFGKSINLYSIKILIINQFKTVFFCNQNVSLSGELIKQENDAPH